MGGGSAGDWCVCENIYACVLMGDCKCWRWGVGGWESTGCQGGQPTLSKITYSIPGFPSSLPQATLLSSSRFRRVCVCVCYIVCYVACVEERRGGEGRVLLRSPGSLPTAPWGEEVTGHGRPSPMTSNALLTPVCKEGHHTTPPPPLPPDIIL